MLNRQRDRSEPLLVPREQMRITTASPNATVSSDGRRIGVREVVDGKIQFKMLKGNLTSTEIRLMQKNLDQQQEFLYKKDTEDTGQ